LDFDFLVSGFGVQIDDFGVHIEGFGGQIEGETFLGEGAVRGHLRGVRRLVCHLASTRGYPYEQIHKSIIGLLPRKHAKSQHFLSALLRDQTNGNNYAHLQ